MLRIFKNLDKKDWGLLAASLLFIILQVWLDLTLPDYIYSTYNALMESGWKFDEIDRMDMLGFLRIRAWSAKRECKKKEPRRAFIDEVWPDLK